MARQNWRIWRRGIDVDHIKALLSHQGTQDAATFSGARPDYRVSKVAWETGNKELQDMLWPYVADMSRVCGIEVNNSCEIQYTEYLGEVSGKYDWHVDVDWERDEPIDRKLSLTVQLSSPDEYEGGEFDFSGGGEDLPDWYKDQGTVLVFPSYLAHRIRPVTYGVRRSLVAWFDGPRWR